MTVPGMWQGVCLEPDKPFPTLSPEIYGSSSCYQRTITTTRAQIKTLSAEILLGTVLGMQDKAGRGLGLQQQEDSRCSLQFSLFFLLLDTPQSMAVLAHMERAVISSFKDKITPVFMKLEIQTAQRPREAMQPGQMSHGDGLGTEDLTRYPSPGHMCEHRSALQSIGSALESFIFLRYGFQCLKLRRGITQSDENVPINRYNHRANRTICDCARIFPFPGEFGAI